MEFLADLDEFFCEKFAGYELFCGLPQYRMPTMQATKTDEYGRKFSYTLPKSTLRLADQEHKVELLAIVKEKLNTKEFSFSVHPNKWHQVLKHRFSKKGFAKTAEMVAGRYNLSFEQLFDGVEIDEFAIKGMKSGEFLPTKNMLFSVALTAQLSLDDTHELMIAGEMEWDYALQRDVVVRYLLERSIYNEEKVAAALKIYKVKHLFIKTEK